MKCGHRLNVPVLMLFSAVPAMAQWTQWGGPNRDFVVKSSSVAKGWAEAGPTEIWKRELGGGYSAILVEGDRLYTMYRDGDEEIITALEAETGKTIWETRYSAPLQEGAVDQFGKGPNATPSIAGDKLIGVGFTGKLHCLTKADGKVVWSHDLWDEFGGTKLDFGYSSSPLVHGDIVIVPVGGEGQSLMAFNIADGAKAWTGGDFKNSFASPMMIEVDGQQQIVIPMGSQIVGYSPDDGRVLWSHPHKNQWDCNISAPQWCQDNILFVSSFGECGSRAIRLSREGDTTTVEEIWANRKLKVGHTTTVHIGDYVYAAHWDGSGFLTAINVHTGEMAWRKRDVGHASLVRVDDAMLALEEDGSLSILRADPRDLEIVCKTEMLESKAWTVPTVVGSRIYVRDNKHIMALEVH
jgi:outer membrane protein assembly factor BamB